MDDTFSIRIKKEDYKGLKKIKERTGIPIVKLISFAIPLLRKEYRCDDSEQDKVVR